MRIKDMITHLVNFIDIFIISPQYFYKKSTCMGTRKENLFFDIRG